MKYDLIIGIDNGATGSIGLRLGSRSFFFCTPTFEEQDYVKEKRKITRLDRKKFKEILTCESWNTAYAYVERPMVNPSRFLASTHALRIFEAQLCCLEDLGVESYIIDSKEWNKGVFPYKMQGEAALKQESFNQGLHLFPELSAEIIKQNEADGLLIAEYGYRQQMGTLTANY